MPGRTKSNARAAAARFCASISIAKSGPSRGAKTNGYLAPFPGAGIVKLRSIVGRRLAIRTPWPVAIGGHGCSPHRLRSRRNAGRYRARSRRDAERHLRPRGPAAGRVRGGAQHGRRRRARDDRTRARGRRAASCRRPRSTGWCATSSRTTPTTSPTSSRPFPGVEAALDALAGVGLPLRGLHQQARMAVGASPRRAWPVGTLRGRLRRRHVRHRQAQSGLPAPDHRSGRRRPGHGRHGGGLHHRHRHRAGGRRAR